MNNLLPTSIRMHEKYDLKGSTYKRKASKSEKVKTSPTYKDLDFMELHPDGLLLESDTYNALIKTLQRDCRVLESFQIMDYSLLVGVHNLDVAAKEKAEEKLNKMKSASAPGSSERLNHNQATDHKNDSSSDRHNQRTFSMDSGPDNDGATSITSNPCDKALVASGASAAIPVFTGSSSQQQQQHLTRSKSINKTRLAAYSTAMESIQAENVDPIDEEDDVPPGGIPARNAKGERLLLFLGVIDILQSYRLKKKLEHTLKSMFTDGDTVSVHRPSFYAQRFLDFAAKTVFKKIPSRKLPSNNSSSGLTTSNNTKQVNISLKFRHSFRF